MTDITNDGSDVISRAIDAGAGVVVPHPRRRREEERSSARLTPAEVRELYDVAETVQRIRAAGAQSVALQLPDALLPDALPLVSALRAALREAAASSGDGGQPPRLCVMADTLFAPCCVDEVTSQHVASDFIVKYGHSCLTRTTRVPVHFVTGAPAPDADAVGRVVQAVERMVAAAEARGLAEVVVAGSPDAALILAALPASPKVRVCTPAATGASGCFVVSGVDLFPAGADPAAAAVVFVGSPESPALPQLLLWAEHVTARTGEPPLFAVCDPASTDPCDLDALPPAAEDVRAGLRRRLRQRLFLLEKVRDAEVVAIVVVSLAISEYAKTVEHLKAILRAAGKQSVVVYVGKPNVPKLANYEDVDLFCVVACPQTSLFSTKEYPKPVVLPVEVAVACGDFVDDDDRTPQVRPEYYTLELGPLLSGIKPTTAEADGDSADVSLVTGRVRAAAAPMVAVAAAAGEEDAEGADLGGAVVQYQSREVTLWQEQPIVQRFQQRSYRGLEPHFGETAVQDEVVQGLSGIASGYTTEPESAAAAPPT